MKRLPEPWRQPVVAAMLVSSLSGHAFAAQAAANGSLCAAQQSVLFNCSVGKKIVSLCSDAEAGTLKSLAYRYGLPGKIENEYVATKTNGLRFHGALAPAHPGALVSQVWFSKGKTKYLLTTCLGRSCSQEAGLAVIQGNALLQTKSCSADQDGSAQFSGELVDFGAGARDPSSRTELLTIEDSDDMLQKIYTHNPRR